MHGSIWVQAFPQPCGLRPHGRATLGFANQSFAFILLKPVFLLLLGIKPVATPGTPLISLTFFPLLFYCRGPWFLEGKG